MMGDGPLRRALLFVLAVVLTVVIFILLVFALSVPARAHSEAEQRAWEQDWVERVQAVGLKRSLLAEYLDFQARHAPVVVQPQTVRISGPSTNRGMGAGVEQWRGLVASYGWDVDTALCLMAKESGGNPNARNPSSGASGLMQVLPSWAPVFGYKSDDLFDPAVNLKISYALYVDGGWNHWSPYLRGECRG